jgi:hypothetical protein
MSEYRTNFMRIEYRSPSRTVDCSLLFFAAIKMRDNLRATPRIISAYSLPRKRVSASRCNGNLVVVYQRTFGSGSTIPAFRRHVTLLCVKFACRFKTGNQLVVLQIVFQNHTAIRNIQMYYSSGCFFIITVSVVQNSMTSIISKLEALGCCLPIENKKVWEWSTFTFSSFTLDLCYCHSIVRVQNRLFAFHIMKFELYNPVEFAAWHSPTCRHV